jgi:hypothetical protein
MNFKLYSLKKKKAGGMFLALLLFLFSSCNHSGMNNAQFSLEELSQEVLVKLYEKDIKSLENLAVTREEFKKHVWPEMQWSKPEVNMPFDYYWKDIHQKSTWALRKALVEYGGENYNLIRVYFAKGVRKYKNFRLHRDTRLIVKNKTGEEKELNILGSILEMNGSYKILSYIHD